MEGHGSKPKLLALPNDTQALIAGFFADETSVVAATLTCKALQSTVLAAGEALWQGMDVVKRQGSYMLGYVRENGGCKAFVQRKYALAHSTKWSHFLMEYTGIDDHMGGFRFRVTTDRGTFYFYSPYSLEGHQDWGTNVSAIRFQYDELEVEPRSVLLIAPSGNFSCLTL
jgi:hypothetical protein